MKTIVSAMFALGILTALPAHAQTAARTLPADKLGSSAIVKVDWDDWHDRWRSHYRWGSHGEWGPGWGWGWHNRWRSHYRWGSNGGWGGEHWRWGSGRRWWR